MMIIAAVATVILGSAVLAPPEKILTQLTTHEFTQTELDTDSPVKMAFSSTKPLSINLERFQLPADFKPTRELLVFIESEDAIALAENAPDGKTISKIWVDWNQNNKAEPSEFATPSGDFKRLRSPFYVLKFAGDNKSLYGLIHVQIVAQGTDMYMFIPTACGEATITLGDKKMLVRVIDSNLNGRFESSLASRGDEVVIPGFLADGRQVPGNPCAFNTLFAMPDARYYRFAITTDSKHLEVTRDETPIGLIEFGSTNLIGLTVQIGKTSLSPKIIKGVASVPSGSYVLRHAGVMRKGPDGQTYICSYAGSADTPLKVKGGEKTSVDLDGPLSLALKVTDKEASKVFNLTGNLKNGLHISGIDKLNARSQADALKAPVLTIVDQEGNIIDKLTFEFG